MAEEIKVIPIPLEVTVRLAERGIRPLAVDVDGQRGVLKQAGDFVLAYVTEEVVEVAVKPLPGLFWRVYEFKAVPDKKVSFSCGLSRIEVRFEEVMM